MNLRLSEEQILKDGLWLEELDGLCSHSGEAVTDSRLVVSTAINALSGWLTDPRSYDGKHRNKWEYAIQDFNETARAIGPELTAILEPELGDAISSLAGLPKDQTKRANAHSKQKALSAKASSFAATVAAWRDLVCGCQNRTLRANQVGYLSRVLWDIAGLAGVDAGSMGVGRELSGVLSDHAFSIAAALADLGDRDFPKHDEFESLEANANLSVQDRLTLCERLLSSPVPETDNVVWLGLDRAGIKQALLDYGPIRFYESEWLCGNLFDNGPFRNELPPELIEPENHIDQYDFVRGKNILLVRVDLGHRSRVGAVEDARELVEAVLTLAAPSSTDWQLMGGFTHFIGGHGRSTRSFNMPAHIDDYSRNYDPTQSEIERLKAEFTPVVPNANPQLAEALEARKWLKDVANADALTRTLTYVRAIERVGSWVQGGSMNWHEFAKGYIREGWAVNQLQDEVHNVAYKALHNTFRLDRTVIDQIEPLKSGVVEPKENGYRMYLDKATAVIPALATIYGQIPGNRALQLLATKVKDGKSISDELDHLCGDFDLLLKRLISCRDSAQHGGPLDSGSVDSVVDFAQYLARIVIWTSLESLLKGDEVEQVFSDKRNQVVQRHADLKAGAQPGRLYA